MFSRVTNVVSGARGKIQWIESRHCVRGAWIQSPLHHEHPWNTLEHRTRSSHRALQGVAPQTKQNLFCCYNSMLPLVLVELGLDLGPHPRASISYGVWTQFLVVCSLARDGFQSCVNERRRRWVKREVRATWALPLCSVSLKDHSDSPLGAAVTLAHELGHNFGMNHDTLERGCRCKMTADKGGCIMSPSTG